MATQALLNFGNMSGKWLLSGVQYHKPKAMSQTTLHHVRYFRRVTDASKQTKSPFTSELTKPGPIHLTRLWKPLGFSIMFSSASIVGSAIWEYENIRARTQRLVHRFEFTRVRRTGWRATVHNWWNSLDEGKKLFVPICFINVLVFCAWRVPALQGTMLRYFCSNPNSSAMCWPMVLSTFSHYTILHLAANMFVLNSFSSPVVAALGKEQFLALYLTSGVMSNLVSYFYKTVFSRPGLSLGASGAIMGILSFACTQYPDSRLSIIFLPMYTFTADSAIKAMVCLDTIGCIMKWQFFDHAAHLGGAAWGIFWQKWGNAYIWQKREPILTFWHEFRGPPRSRS
ncbi:presenilin-associated rhomboid-like protein, mitochondrial isoform X1 [Neodiprion pinetum]|uniref:rhomboid protease n=2 Tax=Neodiprion lecontei TaxID=441921 RepID=A0A6J0BRE0_NEOLC|nr:presenilins-associated rhomboid-like protein, mitochondrial isoform X1 [Neodiprion lecontei]XP_046424049.1 presenilins-associated rhomboid-like protein, mitochondrial isoform X1 [Neodiprion fabricii]XP_046478416.1 presenilins-associated rhomboid-like protein, mitochondrial isoform X1 [Neodiprion pinetum]